MTNLKNILRIMLLSVLITSMFTLIVYADFWSPDSYSIKQTGKNYWQTEYFTKMVYNPVVIMGPPTFNGSEAATMRVKNVTDSSFQFQLDEWNYLDGTHVRENVDAMVFDTGLQDVGGVKVEAGKVSTDHNWVTVRLSNTFNMIPVILAQCATYNGSDAVTVRIRKVTRNSFQVRLQEEEANGDHVKEEIHYAAFEQGKSSGHLVVRTVTGVTNGWTTVTGPTAAPYGFFMANIQTFNGSDTVSLRKRNVSGSTYQIKCEEEQSSDTEVSHTTEDVGIVAYY
jgi:hypothetical protein